MPYEVQRGDTIAKISALMNTDWQTLKRMNPDAVGRSTRNGNWFLKEGSVLQGPESFEARFSESLSRQQAVSETETSPDPAKDPSGDPTMQKEALRPAGGEPEWTTYTIRPGDTLWGLAVKTFHVDPEELIQANGIEDPRTIQPGQMILVPPARELPEEIDVVASWYGQNYHGRPMANGEFFNMYSNIIAHRDLPFGTRVELTNPETGETARAVVKDRGPFVEGRDVDLSYGLARRLSLVEKGVGTLRMKILS
jgi:rare lipoprotein A